MGAIVLDTNAVVRAVLSPAGARRKLWLLLVYGGAVHRAKRIREELQLARESGFRVSGAAEHGLRRAEASIDAVAGLLPSHAPDDLWALASPALLGEYHRKGLSDVLCVVGVTGFMFSRGVGLRSGF